MINEKDELRQWLASIPKKERNAKTRRYIAKEQAKALGLARKRCGAAMPFSHFGQMMRNR
jgi:hypothetical protein